MTAGPAAMMAFSEVQHVSDMLQITKGNSRLTKKYHVATYIPQGKAAVEISIIHQTGIGLPQLTSALTQQCHMTTTITHALSA